MDCLFYLGTHMPHWLRDSSVPLFVSHRRLMKYKRFPTAAHRWALDSGGFTELSMFGGWRTSPAEYVDAVERYRDEIGRMDWAAPQDWMCEPVMLQRTGLTVDEHQARTTDNLLQLRDMAPHLPFVPVLQGWTMDDYNRHIGRYAVAGVHLPDEPLVGVGSVCRRQNSDEIGAIMRMLSEGGIRTHGFGVKSDGIARYGQWMASADSLAWSFTGRMRRPCPHSWVKSCANCRPFAMEWRDRLLTRADEPRQLLLWQ